MSEVPVSYATQTPTFDSGGPREVDCCVRCSPLVVDLRDQVASYKLQAKALAAQVKARDEQLEALAQRAAALRSEAHELRLRLGDEAADIPGVEDRLLPWRRKQLAASGVEIGPRVPASGVIDNRDEWEKGPK